MSSKLDDGVDNSRKKNVVRGVISKTRLWPRQARVTLKAAFLAAILLFLAALNPFGLTAATDTYSENVMDKMLAPFHRNDAQNAVTVVLIDDFTLEEMGEEWPLSYPKQRHIVEGILHYQPRVLFVDVLYRIRHGSESSLAYYASVFEEHSENTTTILPTLSGYGGAMQENGPCLGTLPASRKDNGELSSILPPLRGAPFEHAIVEWSGCDNRYPLAFGIDDGLQSVAFTAVQKYCSHTTPSPACLPQTANLVPEDFQTPMHVRWGADISDANARYFAAYGPDCRAPRATLAGRAVDSALLLLSGVKEAFSGGTSFSRYRRLCPHIQTVSAYQVGRGSTEREQILSDLLTNKIVMLGVGTELVSDFTQSPVNGKLPGIFVHAMATENVLAFHNRYSRDLSENVLLGLEFLTLFIALLWSYRYFDVREHASNATYGGASIDILRAVIMLVIFPFLALIALCLILHFAFRIAPINWIGLFSILGITYAVNLNEKIDRILQLD